MVNKKHFKILLKKVCNVKLDRRLIMAKYKSKPKKIKKYNRKSKIKRKNKKVKKYKKCKCKTKYSQPKIK